MNKEEIHEEYFRWMCSIVTDEKYSKKVTYHQLLHFLMCHAFDFVIPMDRNRLEDGLTLRYRFGSDAGYSTNTIDFVFDGIACSILEMMVALSVRCEEHIMEDDDIGDRTGQWFWNMIVSLGLASMTDERFNEKYCELVVKKFLRRDYDRTGRGGLFTVKNPPQDMRDVEIWYQMCYYLSSMV